LIPYVTIENVDVQKILTVNGGRAIISSGYWLSSNEGISLNNDSKLTIYNNTNVWTGNGGEIYVGPGAEIETHSTPEEKATFSAIQPGDYFHIIVDNGGTIAMESTIFDYLDVTGIEVAAGAEVVAGKAFNNCIFRNGKACQQPLITINTSQDLVAENVEFSGTDRAYNAAKLVDAGSLTFVNATGNLAGSLFEFDLYNRIFWDNENVTQNIEIPAGWSGLSSYMQPSYPAMEDVFEPIANELIIAQTMDAVYYPAQNINNIGSTIFNNCVNL
jgi:hypothetical protein